MKFLRLAVAASALLPLAAHADPRQDLVDGMARCAVVNDSVDRLACYDALYPQLKAAQAPAPFVAVGAPPAAAPAAPSMAPPPASMPAAAPPAVATAAPPPADNRPWYDPGRILGVSPNQQTTPEQFGGENLLPPKPAPGEVAVNQPPAALDSISTTVRDWSFNPYDKFMVVLDNGQIWQQIESDSGKARFIKGAKNTVVISRGFIGSYNMSINDSGAIFKVKRLK